MGYARARPRAKHNPRACAICYHMNGIFAAVFVLSAVLFLIADPDGFLPAMLAGGEKAATLSLSLLCVYCVWLGFFKLLEQSGLAAKLTRALSPAARRLFGSEDRETLGFACENLAANLLGLPGAPTPLGVRAVQKFMAAGNGDGADMLFVLNATSLQLLPTTAITLRAAMGSLSPADILLPTLLSTLFSSLAGVALLLFFRWVKTKAAGRMRKKSGAAQTEAGR